MGGGGAFTPNITVLHAHDICSVFFNIYCISMFMSFRPLGGISLSRMYTRMKKRKILDRNGDSCGLM